MKLVVCSEPLNCSHTWISGSLVKVLRSNGMIIALRAWDSGKNFVIDIGMVNKTSEPVDVVPSTFSMAVLQPKEKELRYQPPEKLIKSISNRTAWDNFFTALGAASATQQVVTQTNTNGNVSAYGTNGSAFGTYSAHSTTTTTIPDEQARQNAAEHIASNNIAVANAAQNINLNVLRAITIAPGGNATGTVYFDRSRKVGTTVTRIPINGIMYEFMFEW